MVEALTIVLFMIAVFGLAGFLLWFRDRRWDRKGVSQADREKYQRKVGKGALIYVSILHIGAAISLFAAFLHAHSALQAVGFAIAGVVFIVLSIRTVKVFVRSTDYVRPNNIQGEPYTDQPRPPGAPPPLG